jgi:DHA2 family multidrug resistance protein
VNAAHRRVIVSAGTVLATMLYTIDTTIVNVALPHMQGTLQATQEQVAWVITSYIVASAIATPLAGWLGMRHGLRLVLGIAVAGFTATSVLCGLAEGLTEMVLARTLQGVFGASLVPLSQVALLQEFPARKHGQVMALWSLGVLVGPVIGPTLGGWLTDELSWRWAFFINVPLGTLAALALWRGLPVRHDATGSRPFDWLGFALLSLGLASFQLMLDRGHTLDWFASPEIYVEATLAALGVYMFVMHATTSRHPFVDLHLFRDRNFVVALLLMFMVGLSIISPTVLVPSFLQTIQGYPATAAGVTQAARGVGAIVAVLIAGRFAAIVPARVLVSLGILSAIGSLLLFAQVSVDTPRHYWVLAGFVNGLSTPLVFVPLSVTAYATLQPAQRAEGGALLTLVRTIGSSIGVSLVVAMLARSAQVNQSYLAENFTAYSVQRWQALGFEPGPDAATAGLVAELGRQASAIGYANDFYLLALATLVVLPLAWLVRGRRTLNRRRSV